MNITKKAMWSNTAHRQTYNVSANVSMKDHRNYFLPRDIYLDPGGLPFIKTLNVLHQESAM